MGSLGLATVYMEPGRCQTRVFKSVPLVYLHFIFCYRKGVGLHVFCQVPFSTNLQKQVMIHLFSNHVQCASHQQELALCESMQDGKQGRRALPARKMANLLSLQGTLVTFEALNRFGDLCGLNPTGVGSGPSMDLGAWKWKREANRGAPFAQARVVPSSGSKEKDLKDFNLGGWELEPEFTSALTICLSSLPTEEGSVGSSWWLLPSCLSSDITGNRGTHVGPSCLLPSGSTQSQEGGMRFLKEAGFPALTELETFRPSLPYL